MLEPPILAFPVGVFLTCLDPRIGITTIRSRTLSLIAFLMEALFFPDFRKLGLLYQRERAPPPSPPLEAIHFSSILTHTLGGILFGFFFPLIVRLFLRLAVLSGIRSLFTCTEDHGLGLPSFFGPPKSLHQNVGHLVDFVLLQLRLLLFFLLPRSERVISHDVNLTIESNPDPWIALELSPFESQPVLFI